MRRVLSLGIAIAVLAGLQLAAAEPCGGSPTMPPLTFDAPQVIDAERAGGEPVVQALPDGALIYLAHAGTTHVKRTNMPDAKFVTPYDASEYLWRSEDAGDTWDYVGLGGLNRGPHSIGAVGFSDPTSAVDAAGNLYIAGIDMTNVWVARSADTGKSWRPANPVDTVITDREWLAADRADEVYLNGNQSGRGRQLWKSTNGGVTFALAKAVTLPGSGAPSPIAVDKSDGRLYFPAADQSSPPFSPGQVAVYPYAREGDFSSMKLRSVPGGLGHQHGFVNSIALDAAGNVYVASNRGRTVSIGYSTDRGNSWKSVTVATASGTVLWPWVSAGDDGSVGIAWLQADRDVGSSTGHEVANYRVYAAQSVTGHGWTDGCAVAHAPEFQVAMATPTPIHVGTICEDCGHERERSVSADPEPSKLPMYRETPDRRTDFRACEHVAAGQRNPCPSCVEVVGELRRRFRDYGHQIERRNQRL